MSPTVEAAAGAGTIAPGMLTANERVQQLQTLAAELRGGPASFAAQLAQASGAQAPSAATSLPATSEQSPIATAVPQASTTSSATSPASYDASSAYPLPPTGQSGVREGAQYTPLIEAAATRNGVDPAVLHGLIQQESGFDPSSRSSAGAEGLTQLMPSTANSLGVSDPLDPAQSIEGGARYLGEMLRRFGGNVEEALAAYNAGPGAVQQYGGVPPYAETQQYVGKVLGYAAEYRAGAGVAS